MALATRCPACSTVFRISTAQAAAKGGMVRCGQCRHVFNSLDALVRVEDLEVIDEVVVESAAEPPSTPEVVDEPAVAAADEAQAPAAGTTDADVSDVSDESSASDGPNASSASDGSDVPHAPDPVDPVVVREWWVPEPDPVADAAAIDRRDDAGQLLSGRRTDLQWPPAELEGTPAFMRTLEPAPPAHRVARWALTGLVLIAGAGLLAQAAYLWRDELAARWSPARGWLTAACEPLRCRVDYPTRLDAITIESASIKTAGSNLNVYELTALLRNRDAIEVRYPYLELVLTDLQDRPILRRALRPEDYLSSDRGAARPPSGFAAQSELPIRITFELSDLRFAGFRVESFYP